MRKKLVGWRRIANAMWRAPDDPQVYGLLEVDATRLRSFIAASRAAGAHVTATHLAGRALARAIAAVPEMNVRIVAGRAEELPTVDVFFITAVEGGRDLSGVKIEQADRKDVFAVCEELRRRAKAMKAGNDPDLARSKRSLTLLPEPLLRAALRVTTVIVDDLGLDVPSLGLRKRPFGSAIVTSVGMLGLPIGFAPLSWMYRAPLLLLVGEITDKPVAIDGRVEVRPVLPLTATIDHRYVDGWHISKLLAPFRAYLEDPAAFEPAAPA